MFNLSISEKKPSKLDKLIDDLLDDLDARDHESEEYSKVADNLIKLQKLRDELKKSSTWRPSPDAIVGAAASLGGILLILNYERAGVIATKALGFIAKAK